MTYVLEFYTESSRARACMHNCICNAAKLASSDAFEKSQSADGTYSFPNMQHIFFFFVEKFGNMPFYIAFKIDVQMTLVPSAKTFSFSQHCDLFILNFILVVDPPGCETTILLCYLYKNAIKSRDPTHQSLGASDCQFFLVTNSAANNLHRMMSFTIVTRAAVLEQSLSDE